MTRVTAVLTALFFVTSLTLAIFAKKETTDAYSLKSISSTTSAPAQSNETSLMLFDRQVIAAQSPELNLGTPSLMFQTQDARALYHKFRDQGITVGDLIEMPNRLVFNFADPEGHYFAIQESQN